MLSLNTLSAISKSITTKQLKVLSQLYGAVCDQQYILTAMPTKMSHVLNANPEYEEWRQEVVERMRKQIAEERQQGMWRDPLTTQVELANPQEGSEDTGGHNISVI